MKPFGGGGETRMRASCKLLVLAAISLAGAACNRQPADEPGVGPQPAEPVVTLTPEAVQQVFRYRDRYKVTGPWRLRIEVKERPGGLGKHLVDLDLDPTSPEDYEYDFEGIRVVIARSQIGKLHGSLVGYRVLPDKEGFYVSNPNMPDTRE
jgi:Fe-S cluster assembly iron-binding protein IscA